VKSARAARLRKWKCDWGPFRCSTWKLLGYC